MTNNITKNNVKYPKLKNASNYPIFEDCIQELNQNDGQHVKLQSNV